MTRQPWELALTLEGDVAVPLSGTCPSVQAEPPAQYQWLRRWQRRLVATLETNRLSVPHGPSTPRVQ